MKLKFNVASDTLTVQNQLTLELVTLSEKEKKFNIFGLMVFWHSDYILISKVCSQEDFIVKSNHPIFVSNLKIESNTVNISAPTVSLKNVQAYNMSINSNTLIVANFCLVRSLKVFSEQILFGTNSRLKAISVIFFARNQIVLPSWMQAENLNIVAKNIKAYNLMVATIKADCHNFHLSGKIQSTSASINSKLCIISISSGILDDLFINSQDVVISGALDIIHELNICSHDLTVLPLSTLTLHGVAQLDVHNCYVDGRIIGLNVCKIQVNNELFYREKSFHCRSLHLVINDLSQIHKVSRVDNLILELTDAPKQVVDRNIHINSNLTLIALGVNIALEGVTFTIGGDFALQAKSFVVQDSQLDAGNMKMLLDTNFYLSDNSSCHVKKSLFKAAELEFCGTFVADSAHVDAVNEIKFTAGAQILILSNLYLSAKRSLVTAVSKKVASNKALVTYSHSARILIMGDLYSDCEFVIYGGKVLVGGQHTYKKDIKVANIDEYLISKFSTESRVVQQKRITNTVPGVLAVGGDLLPEIMATDTYQAYEIINRGLLAAGNMYLSSSHIESAKSRLCIKNHTFDTVKVKVFNNLNFEMGMLSRLFKLNPFACSKTLKLPSNNLLSITTSKRFGLLAKVSAPSFDSTTPTLYSSGSTLLSAQKAILRGVTTTKQDLKVRARKLIIGAKGSRRDSVIEARRFLFLGDEFVQNASVLNIEESFKAVANKLIKFEGGFRVKRECDFQGDATCHPAVIKSNNIVLICKNTIKLHGVNFVALKMITFNSNKIISTPLVRHFKMMMVRHEHLLEKIKIDYSYAVTIGDTIVAPFVGWKATNIEMTATQIIAKSIKIRAAKLECRSLLLNRHIHIRGYRFNLKGMFIINRKVKERLCLPVKITGGDVNINSDIIYQQAFNIVAKHSLQIKYKKKIAIPAIVEVEDKVFAVGIYLPTKDFLKDVTLKLVENKIKEQKARNMLVKLYDLKEVIKARQLQVTKDFINNLLDEEASKRDKINIRQVSYYFTHRRSSRSKSMSAKVVLADQELDWATGF